MYQRGQCGSELSYGRGGGRYQARGASERVCPARERLARRTCHDRWPQDHARDARGAREEVLRDSLGETVGVGEASLGEDRVCRGSRLPMRMPTSVLLLAHGLPLCLLQPMRAIRASLSLLACLLACSHRSLLHTNLASVRASDCVLP